MPENPDSTDVVMDPWTLYWQSGHTHSCITLQSADDANAVAEFWRAFAADMPAGSTVLDLATGNGTVVAMLLAGNPGLEITGVDRATIDPHQTVADNAELGRAAFQGDVDVCDLPFDDGSFDAVTSQFGIEYAPLAQAATEACRILKTGGQVRFLMHHNSGDIVGPAERRRSEMNALLADGGVVESLLAFVNGQVKAEVLEAAGEAHMASDLAHSAVVTQQVFAAVNQVIKSVQSNDINAARELAVVLKLRLTADRDRLQMLEAAALDRSGINALVESLSAGGVADIEVDMLRADTEDSLVIGWSVAGRKQS